MGSVNEVTFLTDTTGNRRFLPFTVTKINHWHNINMDHVYAEAVQLHQDGFKYWFDGAEIAEVEAHNEQYVDRSIEYELIQKYFQPARIGDKAVFRTPTEICSVLVSMRLVSMNSATVQRIGAALKSLGFIRKKKDNRYKYAIKKQADEVTSEGYPAYPNNIDNPEKSDS